MTSCQWYGVIIIFMCIGRCLLSIIRSVSETHIVLANCNYIELLFVFMFSYKFISYIEIAIQIETSIFIM